MKNSLRLLVLVSMACVSAHATLFDYEPFNYSGSSLLGQNGGTGWNGAWFSVGTAPANTIASDGLSLLCPVTFEAALTPLTPSGARVSTGGNAANASNGRFLSQTINLSVDGTVAYASALFRKNTLSGTLDDSVLLEFYDSATPTQNRRWGFGIEAADKPWINANASGQAVAAVTLGQTYFLVAKIVSSASGQDTAYLKVYGDGYANELAFAEPTAWDATVSTSTSAILDKIRIRIDKGNGASTPGEVDEIRIGNSWLDVVSVPEPSAMALGGLALLAGALWKRRA